jgi:hypothetical protein
MGTVEVKVEGALDQVLSIGNQVEFAAARSLTEVAKQGQESSIRAIQATFQTRARWFLPSNRFGVRVKAARKGDLEATVGTAADWLVPHETGGTKHARAGDLAIPIVGTGTARPRFSSKVRRELKPRALGDKAFIIQTKSGPVLFFRRGKKQRLTALYNLERSAKIRRQSVIIEPTVKVVRRRFDSIFEKNLRDAFASAKGGTREASGVWAFD